MSVVEVTRGDGPVVLGLPHTGTDVPPEVWARLNARGRALADTDWHVDRLYDRLLDDLTVVRAGVHRYVIDVNRPPKGESLYPGQGTTGLVPLTDFEGEPIWEEAPDATEVEARRAAVHAPYHAALAAEVERVRAAHEVVVLWDAHSIRSRLPFLFEGRLPDLNIGTFDGRSCASSVQEAAHEVAASSPYAAVVNGRFKGGWTTRHYGRPQAGVHAIQMEVAQSAYLVEEAPPWRYDQRKADRLRRWLAGIMRAVADAAAELPRRD